MKHIAVLGGGTGTYTVLSGLKGFTSNLTAIVSMADSGGSTGRLRDEQGVLPPGDIRSCLVALSDSSDLTRKLFTYRFTGQGELGGHNVGNVLLAALEKITGSFEAGIEEASRMLNVVGRVVPVTTTNTHLVAELEGGRKLTGQHHFYRSKPLVGEGELHTRPDADRPIKKVWLKPKAKPTAAAITAIEQADLIVIGPGSLFSSIIPLLLVEGVPEAIKRSKAKKIYVANLMTQHGETDGYSLTDLVDQVERYLGKHILDYVIFNSREPSARVAKQYAAEQAYPIEWDAELASRTDWLPVPADLASANDFWRHDSAKLASLILTVSELENVFAFTDTFERTIAQKRKPHAKTPRTKKA